MIRTDVELDHDYCVIAVEGNTRGISAAYDWCVEIFGPPSNRWFYKNNQFYFKNHKDYMWFELRW